MSTHPNARATPAKGAVIASSAFLGGLIAWVYWPAIQAMAEKWQSDPQYSHGYLVPAFAIGLAFWRWKQLQRDKCRSDWRGLLLVAAGAMAYVAGGYLNLDFIAAGSLVPTLFGAVLILGGPVALRWSWPMIAFLLFMVPLPFRLEHALSGPLRGLATQGSTWTLQTIGLPAVSEGNVILLEQGRIAVVEACNGLSMLLTFAAMSTAIAMVSTRPYLERIIVVLSTVPIALIVNIARITANGIAIDVWDAQTAHDWFHDQGGWLMMPMALGLLGLEVWALRRLFVYTIPKPADPVVPISPSIRRAVPTAS